MLSTSIWCSLPRPNKGLIEAAIERWKVSRATTENPSPKPNLEQFDEICEDPKSWGEIAKLSGMYSSSSTYGAWQYL